MVSAHDFSDCYPSDSLPYPTAGQASGWEGLSCLLGLNCDKIKYHLEFPFEDFSKTDLMCIVVIAEDVWLSCLEGIIFAKLGEVTCVCSAMALFG